MSEWKILKCSPKDLQLWLTLGGGQSFRWHKNEENEWTGVFSQRIWTLKQKDEGILFKVLGTQSANHLTSKAKGISNHKKTKGLHRLSQMSTKSLSANDGEDEKLLNEYFSLDFPLQEMYEQWSTNDPNFKKVAEKFYGVRILKQDPTENIFAFICSSNNHISRISSMVEKLCSLYGPLLTTINGKSYHGFPSIESLAGPNVEQVLRDAGFGYRSKFIQKSAEKIKSEGGQPWLEALKNKSYEDAKSALMGLPGIGAKVADCICLMSLGHLQAIPVDTHVWQISCRYLPHLSTYKSVTDKVYNEIGEYFRSLYGPSAGWAHTVLFCADLKMFQDKTIKSVKRRTPASEGKRKKVCN